MNEHEHGLSEAWRGASRDEPPPALDDAIRAAARREVGAGPRRSRIRSWMPLAAAATVAALAIGIVEMVERDELAPGIRLDNASAPAPMSPPSTSASKSESESPAQIRRAPPALDALKEQAPAAGASRSPETAPPSGSGVARNDSERRDVASKQDAHRNQSQVASSPASPAERPQAFPAAPQGGAQAGAPPVDRAVVAEKARSSEPPPAPVAQGFAAATPPRSEPKGKLEEAPNRARGLAGTVERDDGALQAPQRPSPMQSRTSRQEGASTQSTATPAAVAKLAQPDVQGEVSRSSPFPATAAAPPPASPPAMRVEPAAPTSSGETRLLQQARKASPQTANDVASATGQANGTSAASPQALDTPAAKTKDVPPRPADEWIKLIQRLRYEGKIAQAAKELASFRDAYKDKADALLPPDLRDPRP